MGRCLRRPIASYGGIYSGLWGIYGGLCSTLLNDSVLRPVDLVVPKADRGRLDGKAQFLQSNWAQKGSCVVRCHRTLITGGPARLLLAA
jgi:hypothetical protein